MALVRQDVGQCSPGSVHLIIQGRLAQKMVQQRKQQEWRYDLYSFGQSNRLESHPERTGAPPQRLPRYAFEHCFLADYAVEESLLVLHGGRRHSPDGQPTAAQYFVQMVSADPQKYSNILELVHTRLCRRRDRFMKRYEGIEERILSFLT